MTTRPQNSIGLDAPLSSALEILNVSDQQIVVVVGDGRVAGTITDGDIRRALLRGATLAEPASTVMNRSPVTAPADAASRDLVALMLARQVRHLPLVARDGTYRGLVGLDDLHEQTRPHQALIMAGGEGKRLRPLTAKTPKPLLPVGGRPLLETLVRQLRKNGFTHITISVNYLRDRIKAHFGDGSAFGVDIDYLDEPAPMGTVGALSLLETRLHQPLLIMNGDILTAMNFRAFHDFHVSTGAAVTMGVRSYRHQVPYGVVNTKGLQVTSIEEKPEYDVFVNAGLYVIEPSVIDGIPRQRLDMTDLIGDLLASDRSMVAAYPIHEYWRDIGREADLRHAGEEFDAVFGDGAPATANPQPS